MANRQHWPRSLIRCCTSNCQIIRLFLCQILLLLLPLDVIARGIRFRVNRTELLQDDPFIPLYNDSLVPWLKKNNLVLREVYVKGAASPEGPYLNNVRLSRERTKRLIEFLSSNLDQRLQTVL